MSLIKLQPFDSSKLFHLATEPGYRCSREPLAINPDHVCSVTVAKYGSHTIHHSGPNNLTYVFLPARIALSNGDIHEVMESFDSVLCLIKSGGDHGPVGRVLNPGFTIDRSKDQYNKELVARAA